MTEDGAGSVVEIDEDVADAPGGKGFEGAGEHGFAPERKHGFGGFQGERAQAGAKAGGENEGFAWWAEHGQDDSGRAWAGKGNPAGRQSRKAKADLTWEGGGEKVRG